MVRYPQVLKEYCELTPENNRTFGSQLTITSANFIQKRAFWQVYETFLNNVIVRSIVSTAHIKNIEKRFLVSKDNKIKDRIKTNVHTQIVSRFLSINLIFLKEFVKKNLILNPHTHTLKTVNIFLKRTCTKETIFNP